MNRDIKSAVYACVQHHILSLKGLNPELVILNEEPLKIFYTELQGVMCTVKDHMCHSLLVYLHQRIYLYVLCHR